MLGLVVVSHSHLPADADVPLEKDDAVQALQIARGSVS